jgi:hypothetical protein
MATLQDDDTVREDDGTTRTITISENRAIRDLRPSPFDRMLDDPFTTDPRVHYAQFVVLNGDPQLGVAEFGQPYRHWIQQKQAAGLVDWDNNRDRHFAVGLPPQPEVSEPAEPEPPEERQPTEQPEEPPAEQPPERTTRPDSQNGHMWAMLRDNRLKGNTLLVGMVAAQLCYAQRRGDTEERDMSSTYLAKWTGLGKTKAGEAMAYLTKLGYFRRLDSGKGGRGGTGRARYEPMMPAE